MPERKGTTPAELRDGLDAIIDYLAVEKASHMRYQPRDGLTFCNIYAHDYCQLAGVYLPRVWWTPGAIERLAQGEDVTALLGQTRSTSSAPTICSAGCAISARASAGAKPSTLTKLQPEANNGAIGLIVARRVEDGKSGHIVACRAGNRRRSGQAQCAAARSRVRCRARPARANFRHGTGRSTGGRAISLRTAHSGYMPDFRTLGRSGISIIGRTRSRWSALCRQTFSGSRSVRRQSQREKTPVQIATSCGRDILLFPYWAPNY